MFDQKLRKVKERLLTPTANQLPEQINPTMVSIASFLVGLLAVIAILKGASLIAVVMWLLSRVLDGLDGTLARIKRVQTDIGAYLDVLFDFLLYTFIPFALVIRINTLAAYVALSLLFATFYINAMSWMYLSSLLERRRDGADTRRELTSVTMPSSIIEGTETIVLYTLFIVFSEYVVGLFLLMGVLVAVGVVQRVIAAIRLLTR